MTDRKDLVRYDLTGLDLTAPAVNVVQIESARTAPNGVTVIRFRSRAEAEDADTLRASVQRVAQELAHAIRFAERRGRDDDARALLDLRGRALEALEAIK